MKEYKKTLDTRVGMWGIWNSKTAVDINDYKEWEKKFIDDSTILELINKKEFIPINLRSDGVLEFIIRYGENIQLTDREKKHLLAESSKYIIISDGELVVSGIEYIEKNFNESRICKIETEKCYVSAKIFIIDWKAEPNMTDNNGNPKKEALPDLVILMSPIKTNTPFKYSKSIETFNREDEKYVFMPDKKGENNSKFFIDEKPFT